jgi:hypothetical protein
MPGIRLVTTTVVALATFASPGRSQQVPPPAPQVSREEIVQACVQDRVEVLPPLFTDVPPNHWAFLAVQKISYCGPFRSATPPNLIERLIREDGLLPNPMTLPESPEPTL